MQFELTAKGNMFPGGQTVYGGSTYTVHVNLSGIDKDSVLVRNDARDLVVKQLAAQGLVLPPHGQGYLSYGQWSVKNIGK